MKGIVFNLRKNRGEIALRPVVSSARRIPSAGDLLRRYGIRIFFSALFVMGLVVGAACSSGIDKDLFDRLDFIFVTNIEARGAMTPFGIFSSCFVSYFIFVFLMLLFGLSAWGFPAVPVLFLVKGFSVGLSSAFMFAMYAGSGIGFYILIVLPGTVGFLFVMLRYARDSFFMSLDYARLSVFGLERAATLRSDIRRFSARSLYAFLLSGACAVADMLLWVLFADKFHFY